MNERGEWIANYVQQKTLSRYTLVRNDVLREAHLNSLLILFVVREEHGEAAEASDA